MHKCKFDAPYGNSISKLLKKISILFPGKKYFRRLLLHQTWKNNFSYKINSLFIQKRITQCTLSVLSGHKFPLESKFSSAALSIGNWKIKFRKKNPSPQPNKRSFPPVENIDVVGVGPWVDGWLTARPRIIDVRIWSPLCPTTGDLTLGAYASFPIKSVTPQERISVSVRTTLGRLIYSYLLWVHANHGYILKMGSGHTKSRASIRIFHSARRTRDHRQLY